LADAKTPRETGAFFVVRPKAGTMMDLTPALYSSPCGLGISSVGAIEGAGLAATASVAAGAAAGASADFGDGAGAGAAACWTDAGTAGAGLAAIGLAFGIGTVRVAT
jgi:hypothetical protein